MAYQLLRGAAAKRTETIVIEAGVDAEGSFKPELPLGLVDLLSRQVDIVENDIQVSRSFECRRWRDSSQRLYRLFSGTYWDGCLHSTYSPMQ